MGGKGEEEVVAEIPAEGKTGPVTFAPLKTTNVDIPIPPFVSQPIELQAFIIFTRHRVFPRRIYW